MKHYLITGLFVAGIASMAPAAGAAIVAGGDGTQNTTAAGTVVQFNNVGTLGVGSGIYLGDGVVLTAAHVGAGTIVIGGTPYTPVAGSDVRLVDPNDSQPTDLVLFRINPDAALTALPTLNIASSTPTVGTSVVLVGNGRNRNASETFYDVSGSDPNFTWTELPDATGAERSGYKWASGNSIRWGNNVTENATLVGEPAGPTVEFNAGFGDIRSILTDFDNVLNEGQAANGDSGGAMFDAAGNLVGLMHSIDLFEDQPGETAIFGNVTYAADLSHYRSQIVAYIPEPSSAGMLLLAACGALAARRRRA
jgi:hypothetical protein